MIDWHDHRGQEASPARLQHGSLPGLRRHHGRHRSGSPPCPSSGRSISRRDSTWWDWPEPIGGVARVARPGRRRRWRWSSTPALAAALGLGAVGTRGQWAVRRPGRTRPGADPAPGRDGGGGRLRGRPRPPDPALPAARPRSWRLVRDHRVWSTMAAVGVTRRRWSRPRPPAPPGLAHPCEELIDGSRPTRAAATTSST